MEDERNAAQEQQPASESEAQGHDQQEAAPTHEEKQVAGTGLGHGDGSPVSGVRQSSQHRAAPTPETERTGPMASEADWKKQLDAKDAEMADMRIGYELRLAGARNVTAAKALLAEHKGDIAALKAAEPWMFAADAAGVGGNDAPKGATGLSSAGAAVDEGATLKRWRKLAGLEDEKQ